MSKTIEVYFSFSSPFAYLAKTQFPGLIERYQCNINYRPIDLRLLWKLTGNQSPAQIPNKLQYLMKDIGDWSKYYQVPFQMPSRFPMDNRPPSAAAFAAKKTGKFAEFIGEVLEAYYVSDLDIASPEVLGKIGAELGLDKEAIISAINDAEINQQIDAETETAANKGVFGVPTFFIGEDMYWGNDRLIFVEEALNN